MTVWQEHNLAAIKRRLAAVRRAPSGVLFERTSPHNHILVRRVEDQLLLCYRHAHRRIEEVQSRLGLSAPLSLLSDYTQAMLLALAWRPEPWSVSRCLIERRCRGRSSRRQRLTTQRELPLEEMAAGYGMQNAQERAALG